MIPDMKRADRMVMNNLSRFVPVLQDTGYKGSSGKVAVVGGSIEYTGAPYFSAKSALRAGADLAIICCHRDASSAIKSYSPDIIVRPYPEHFDVVFDEWHPQLERLRTAHVIVIGPGLGRQDDVQNVAWNVMAASRKNDKPLIIDGDGLHCDLSSLPITKWNNVIMTPNASEFQMLWNKSMDTPSREISPCPHMLGEGLLFAEVKANHNSYVQDTVALAQKYPGSTIVRKGYQDVISDGSRTWVCGWKGSRRRVSGQGDILSGICATMLGWSLRSQNHSSVEAALAACIVVRQASLLTFNEYGLSMVASDMLKNIGNAVKLFSDMESPGLGS
uniref:ATP-dependent (S)-NAD(P)H-hydrate dehydratase n=1 Tax=Spongospora subterranea TaxID=70186 RepID=A0A0H5QH35_9EUKA|eukprot:CRZ00957.1 hypothetical protein [Spongospora subterranea]